jgi:hypothetical protein
MPENESTLTLDPSDDGFVLRRTTSDGKTESLFLSDSMFLALHNQLQCFGNVFLPNATQREGAFQQSIQPPLCRLGSPRVPWGKMSC